MDTYANDTATLFGAAGQQLSPEGICELIVTNGDVNGFLLTANAIGAQVADIGCTVLTLNQAGIKTPDGPPPVLECW